MMKEDAHLKNIDAFQQELRRGAVVLAVLSQLDDEQYGYSLIGRLAQQGMEVDQGTLYPLLRRLESKGLLQSEWRVEGSRPRRYYRISPAGERARLLLVAEWRTMAGVMEKLLSDL